MKIISHRGNLDGPVSNKENHPDYIRSALRLGYDVEIDVWFKEGVWCLGHDYPTYEIEFNFLLEERFWLHAKNGDAFNELLQERTVEANVFWHTDEDWILTSKGYIWTYPNILLYQNSICVMPELGYKGNLSMCYAVCSDYSHSLKRPLL